MDAARKYMIMVEKIVQGLWIRSEELELCRYLNSEAFVQGPTCHMCGNPPRESSIYCSEKCIKAHASQVTFLVFI